MGLGEGPRTVARAALDRPVNVKNDNQEAARLLDLQALGAYLGRPWRSLERQLQNPPPGFPRPIQFGRRVFWAREQVDFWLRGELLIAPVVAQAQGRGRGRPRKTAEG